MQAIIDPTNSFPDVPHPEICQALGVLPVWATNEGEFGGFVEAFKNQYPFWDGLMEDSMAKGSISEGGVFDYPEDRPLSPLLKLESSTEECFIYQYAMVAVRHKESGAWVMFRVD